MKGKRAQAASKTGDNGRDAPAPTPRAVKVHFTLNGADVNTVVDDNETLLDLLREEMGVLSPKRGCQPRGQCGACVAIVDGEPHATCTIDATGIEGRTVTTLEGLAEEERSQFAAAFVAAGGLQCGFCLPGIVLRASHLLGQEPDASRARMAAALREHLCRCTGYLKILDAIENVARARRGTAIDVPTLRTSGAAAPSPPSERKAVERGGVGDSLARFRGRELVLGEAPFVDDLTRPGMLHGAVTLSEHARARVRAIDTAAARAHPGVVAVLTAADVPGERWNGLIIEDWPLMVAEGEEVRCVGDVLAIVAATDERIARAAAQMVRVEYEPLPAVLDPEAALEPGAVQVHPHHPNLLSESIIRRGDADAALEASAHVVHGTWQTQRIEHLFLEPECALAEPLASGRLQMFTQSQGIFDDRRQIARILAIPEDDVSVELVPAGGAFGGKEDLSIQGHAALLAWVTQRPAKLALSRPESIRMHPKRHPIRIELSAGCDEEGRLTAVKARMIGDTGPYASVGAKVLERAAGHACGPYRVPHVDIEGRAVRTHNPPCGAMRGFGAPQAAFAIEAAVDMLAARAGLDRWEMRWRNAVQVGDPLTTGQVLEKSVGIAKTLRAVEPAYREALARGRAVGIACGIKNVGLGNGAIEWGKARLVVEPDGTVSIYIGYTEMGQGLLTVMIQIAAETSGVESSRFRPRVDTRYALACGQTTGSRATLLGGRAVHDAAVKLRAELDRGSTLEQLAGREFSGETTVDDTTALGDPDPARKIKTHTTYGYATQLVILDGAGCIERVVAAHDVGRAINPLMCEGQIEGAIHMGLGYALSEELPCADGMPITFSLYQIGALRAQHMPEVEVILVEEPEPEGPYGAKGLGEIGLVPTAAAVAGALEAFDGERRTVLPMKDSPAARALSVGKIRTKVPREDWR